MADQENMVARVAWVIRGAINGAQHFADFGPNEIEAAARGCIEVMREPTKAQVRTATLSFPPWGGHGEASAPSTEDMWRAMIDAALKEQP